MFRMSGPLLVDSSENEPYALGRLLGGIGDEDIMAVSEISMSHRTIYRLVRISKCNYNVTHLPG